MPKPTTEKQNVITELQIAQLSALGIAVYQSIEGIDVAKQSWLPELCKLLGITVQNCVFDSQSAVFNQDTKTLHLPAISYAREAELKKSIWLNVRQFVA